MMRIQYPLAGSAYRPALAGLLLIALTSPALAQACANGTNGTTVTRPDDGCPSNLARIRRCPGEPDIFIACVSRNNQPNNDANDRQSNRSIGLAGTIE
jgi:hypothetical protein